MRTLREAMKTKKHDGLSLSHKLANFLLTYHTTPHSTTGTLSGLWDELYAPVGTFSRPMSDDVFSSDKPSRRKGMISMIRTLQEGQAVKNFGSGESWQPGVVAKQLGPVTYLVDLSADRFWKRHVDHLKELGTPPT